MPERRVHNHFTKLLLGKTYDEVHRALDSPAKFLGRGHRVLFHDRAEAALIGYAIAGDEGALAAHLHVTLDELCSQNKGLADLIMLW